MRFLSGQEDERKEYLEALGDFIRYLRLNKFPGKGSLTNCAKEFKIAPSNWARWEAGKALPSAVNLQNLSIFFGIPMEEFVAVGKGVPVVECELCEDKNQKITALEKVITELTTENSYLKRSLEDAKKTFTDTIKALSNKDV